MPEAILKPRKRVLGDATKSHRNQLPISPNTAKKRKLDTNQPPVIIKPLSQNGSFGSKGQGSSQPHKSQFEEEVLEKLTQDISGLKQNNAEKDQQWERPALANFDETRDALCFQQIEAEKGTLAGGKTAVKLFGVTEVSPTPFCSA
jgi:DNA polymerase delta subunit 1